MEGSRGSPLTQQPPPAKEDDEAAQALTKRARKRSRYLSPPYTDADVQEREAAVEQEEEEAPPDVSAADAVSALQDAALWQGLGQGLVVDAPALHFLAQYRRTTTGTFDNHPDSSVAAADDSHDGGTKKPPSPAAGGVGHTMLDFSAGPAMPRPYDGSPSTALAKKKKKNPQAPPAVKQQNGPMQNASAVRQAARHIWASKSAGFAVNAAYSVPNPAPPEKRRRMKSSGHKQHLGNPVVLVLDFAAGAPLPSKEDLISTFRRFGTVIDSETTIAQDKHSARVAFATRAEAEAAYSCAGTPSAFGLPSAVPSLQDLPPIILSAPPPLPKLPLTDIRNNLEKMISSLNDRCSSLAKPTAEAVNSPEEAMRDMGNLVGEAMPAMGDLVGQMQVLLAKVDKKLQGPSATAYHG